MKRINFSKLLFFLILFFLPQQFGPHFWPPFSYVSGIRLDYLSLTIYVSDILIVLLFVFSARAVFQNRKTQMLFLNKFFALFVLLLFIPLLYSPQPYALLFGILKLFEFFYLGLYISLTFSKDDFFTSAEVLSVVGVLESVLSSFQFFHQGSLNGLFYFLGERFYTLSTPGIAAMNTPVGLMVRPYGTFPHPNVLAFFLFMSVVFASYAMHHTKSKKRIFFLISVTIMEVGLFLTFSRVILFVNILFLIYAFGFVTIRENTKRIQNYFFVLFLSLFTLLYLFLNSTRFLNLSGIVHDALPRYDLTLLSISAIKSSPLAGLGVNQFYYFESSKQLEFSSIHLQPVHNIFLFVASNVGVLGLFIFLYFFTVGLLTVLKSVKKQKLFSIAEIPFVLLLSVILVGLFDHFFLTTQQGTLMLAIILGISFSKSSNLLNVSF